MWQSLLIELGVSLVKSYINSTESKKDDKVLEIVQNGASYLAEKPNNKLTTDMSNSLNNIKIKKIQG